MSIIKGILELVDEIKLIDKKDFLYPTDSVADKQNVVGKMDTFELQIFTKLRRLSLEHEKLHANGNHDEKEVLQCIRYNMRENLLKEILLDSVVQRLEIPDACIIEFKKGGKIEAVSMPSFSFFGAEQAKSGSFMSPGGEA
jgi:hypothetical protein